MSNKNIHPDFRIKTQSWANPEYHQELMDKAYDFWNQPGNEMDWSQLQDAVSDVEKAALVIGKMNQQVENGGWTQWIDNGYFGDIDTIQSYVSQIPGPASKKVYEILSRVEKEGNTYKEMEAISKGISDGMGYNYGYEEGTEAQEYMDNVYEYFDEMDDAYYAINDEFLQEVNSWLIQYKDQIDRAERQKQEELVNPSTGDSSYVMSSVKGKDVVIYHHAQVLDQVIDRDAYAQGYTGVIDDRIKKHADRFSMTVEEFGNPDENVLYRAFANYITNNGLSSFDASTLAGYLAAYYNMPRLHEMFIQQQLTSSFKGGTPWELFKAAHDGPKVNRQHFTVHSYYFINEDGQRVDLNWTSPVKKLGQFTRPDNGQLARVANFIQIQVESNESVLDEIYDAVAAVLEKHNIETDVESLEETVGYESVMGEHLNKEEDEEGEDVDADDLVDQGPEIIEEMIDEILGIDEDDYEEKDAKEKDDADDDDDDDKKKVESSLKFSGTWSGPTTEEKAKELVNFLSNMPDTLPKEEVKDKLYNLIGDDGFFDAVEELNDPVRKEHILSLAKSVLKKWIANPDEWKGGWEPGALNIIKSFVFN